MKALATKLTASLLTRSCKPMRILTARQFSTAPPKKGTTNP